MSDKDLIKDTEEFEDTDSIEDIEDMEEDDEDFDDDYSEDSLDSEDDEDEDDGEESGRARTSDFHENVIEWYNGQKTIALTLSQRKLINKLKKLREKYPEEVELMVENADGTCVFHIPLSYLKISKRKPMSEERRQAMSEQGKRMAEKYFKKKKPVVDNEEDVADE